MSEPRKTWQEIKSVKSTQTPLVCLTAYTAPIAKILDKHCDLLLVGDTLGMVMYGMDSTREVSVEMMIEHGKAVMRGSQQACVIIDLPFGSYERSPEQALQTARRIIDETGASGVKLEGGAPLAPSIKAIVDDGIPVVAHIGLLPQSVQTPEGFRVQGRQESDIARLMDDARTVEDAGAFAVVIEATVESVASQITKALHVPTIGIGASVECDGQILVIDDMLGLLQGHTPKFVRQYANLAEVVDKAAASYAADVRGRAFPSAEYVYRSKAS